MYPVWTIIITEVAFKKIFHELISIFLDSRKKATVQKKNVKYIQNPLIDGPKASFSPINRPMRPVKDIDNLLTPNHSCGI